MENSLFAGITPEVPSHVLDETDAHSILTPHLTSISECLQAGCDAWRHLGIVAPNMVADSTGRTKANIIYDAIVSAARTRFQQDPKVKFVARRGTCFLVIEGKITLRFKKMTASGKTSNIATNQQTLFALQEQLALPGMPLQPTNLTAGYQLDLIGLNLKRQIIRCVYDKETVWEFELPSTSIPAIVLNTASSQDKNSHKTKTSVKLKPHLDQEKQVSSD